MLCTSCWMFDAHMERAVLQALSDLNDPNDLNDRGDLNDLSRLHMS